MKIEYGLTPSGRIYKDGIEVQQDDREADYLAYVVWLKKGNGPGDIEEVAPVDKDPNQIVNVALEIDRLETEIALLRLLVMNTKEGT